MSLTECINIATYAEVYIGNADEDTELIRVDEASIPTDDNLFTDGTPKAFLPGLNKKRQSGPRVATATLSFYGTDILLHNILQGKSVDNSSRSSSPGNYFYSLLLVHADPDSDQNVYIPKIMGPDTESFSRSKSSATKVVVTLTTPPGFNVHGQEITVDGDPVVQKIVYYDTIDNLTTLLDVRSPF